VRDYLEAPDRDTELPALLDVVDGDIEAVPRDAQQSAATQTAAWSRPRATFPGSISPCAEICP